MSQSEIVFRHDEFGGLDWLGLPGQDPDLVIQVITELLTEMKPKNVIEGTVKANAPAGSEGV